MADEYGWQRVAALGDIAPGEPHGAKYGEREVVLVSAVRTPIGRIRGALSGIRPDDLAAQVVTNVLA